MTSEFNIPSDNDHVPNYESFDYSVQPLYNSSTDYGDIPINIQNNNEQQPIPIPVQYYHQTSSPQHQQNETVPMPQVSISKIQKTVDGPSQNQRLKIGLEIEIVIKLKSPSIPSQNDRHSSANHSVNRMHPYRRQTEQNFRNINRNNVHSYYSPQLNRQNDNDRVSQFQFRRNSNHE